ncbi:unnamed protein product [Closterium sp. Naga37s-1]|nr:unnamed protein product [Closterium sp. Naga37s-1]
MRMLDVRPDLLDARVVWGVDPEYRVGAVHPGQVAPLFPTLFPHVPISSPHRSPPHLPSPPLASPPLSSHHRRPFLILAFPLPPAFPITTDSPPSCPPTLIFPAVAATIRHIQSNF